MSTQPNPVRKKYRSQLDRSLHQAIAHRIAVDFPRVGGDRMVDLCATVILETLSQHLRHREHLSHGQILWAAISAEHRPARHQRIADTELVPVVLDVSTAEDIQARLDGIAPRQRLLARIVRLCNQAHQQGGLLSNCDLSEILSCNETLISTLLAAHERDTQEVVPRRATLHDVGTALTHKAIICRKHYGEGKTADVVAQETYHALSSADRYLGQYARVRECRMLGLDVAQTAHLLQCSQDLVKEYLTIDDELTTKPDGTKQPGNAERNT